MKQAVPFLMLLAALCACAPDSMTEEERRAADARADSSAAGYDVGPVSSGRPPVDQGSGRRPGSVDSTASRSPAAGSSADSTKLSPPRPDTLRVAPRDTSSNSGAGGRGSGTTNAGTSGAGKPGRDSAATTLPPLSPEVEATFLTYDSVKKTVTFQLSAGDQVPAQVSFNGVRRGARTLTVPLGWRVRIEFANHDPELPHSATIIAATGSVPEQVPEPAFPRAQTVRLGEGLLEGDSDEIEFVADRAGRYALACGVLGHAQRGQWITLEIAPASTIPRYR